MTAETYDFQKNDNTSYFNHLLLESDRAKITELSKQNGFDPNNLVVKLEINGMPLRIEEFNDIMNDWGERLVSQVKSDLKYNESEEAVVEKAKELIKSKLDKTLDILNDVENSLWKLEG